MDPPGSASRPLPDLFNSFVEAVEEYAIFLLDPEGYVVSWNPGAERVKGYAADEIIGSHFSRFYLDEDVEAGVPAEALEAAARDGQWRDEGWRLRKDGSRFWADVTLSVLRDDDGTLRGYSKVTRDMTDRHQREAELKQAKERAEQATERARQENNLLRLMQQVAATANRVETLSDAVEETINAVCSHTRWDVGHAYRVTDDSRLAPTSIWSSEAAQQFEPLRAATKENRFAMGEGMPGRVAARGEPGWISDVTDASGFVRDEVAIPLGVRGALAFPVRLRGETVMVLEFFSRTPEQPDEGFLQAMESVGLQLSRVAERDRARKALRESEEKFRALAEQSLVGIELIQDGTYVYVNPTFAGYFGYEPEELIGASPEKIVHPGDWFRVRALLQQRLEGTREEAKFSMRGVTRDGETVHLETTGRRIDYNGRPAIVGGSLDVTEKRHLEEKLVGLQDEERRRIGHDLHDGVAPLLAAASMMGRSLAEKIERGDVPEAEEAEQIARHLQSASDEVRAISRGLSPPGLDFGLPVALEDYATSTDTDDGPACSFEADPSIPEFPESTANHLYRIAQEAVNNALRHAEAEHIWIRIETDDNGSITLRIEDDGAGMQEQPSSESSLGLRTMRHRANLIGGTLSFEERPGGGTVVRCDLGPQPFE